MLPETCEKCGGPLLYQDHVSRSAYDFAIFCLACKRRVKYKWWAKAIFITFATFSLYVTGYYRFYYGLPPKDWIK